MTLTTIHPVTGRYVRGCEVPDCERVHMAWGLCHRHYDRWYAHGHADEPPAALQPLTTEDADRMLRLDEVRKLPVTTSLKSDDYGRMATMACWKSANDAQDAATRLLLRFAALDELAAQYDAAQGTDDGLEPLDAA